MARCGRCGLWCPYPDDHHEKVYAGVCLWFQVRLTSDEHFEKRECPEFFERIPSLTPAQHFEYKLKRDDIGKAYREARRAKFVGYTALVLSILGLVLKLMTLGGS